MKHGHTQHFQQCMARLARPEPVEEQQHSRQLMCKALHTPGIGHAALGKMRCILAAMAGITVS